MAGWACESAAGSSVDINIIVASPLPPLSNKTINLSYLVLSSESQYNAISQAGQVECVLQSMSNSELKGSILLYNLT